MSVNKVITTALAGIIAVSLCGGAMAKDTATTNDSMEKCYGIAKKGMNDCATSTNACSGQSTQDASSDAWIYLPKGVCDKIVGGRTTPPTVTN